MRKLIAPLTLSLGCCIVALALFFSYIIIAANSNGPLAKDTHIVLRKGLNLKHIASQLHTHGIIDSPLIFRIMVHLIHGANQLQAGEYAFPANASPRLILDKLIRGDIVIRRITIPEGYTTREVIEALDQAIGLEGAIPDNLEEGSLLPETYHYSFGDTKALLIQRMQSAMQTTLNTLWQQRSRNSVVKTPYEALILASIVEKETGLDAERGRVAAVFINRLKKRMKLQTDPTVIYALTDGKQTLDRPLSRKDLKIISPYNTYLHYGLPPTPIANPGTASIEAVLKPPQTDEFYFVADGMGGHKFSRTLKEHNKHVRALRQHQRKQKQQLEN